MVKAASGLRPGSVVGRLTSAGGRTSSQPSDQDGPGQVDTAFPQLARDDRSRRVGNGTQAGARACRGGSRPAGGRSPLGARGIARRSSATGRWTATRSRDVETGEWTVPPPRRVHRGLDIQRPRTADTGTGRRHSGVSNVMRVLQSVTIIPLPSTRYKRLACVPWVTTLPTLAGRASS